MPLAAAHAYGRAVRAPGLCSPTVKQHLKRMPRAVQAATASGPAPKPAVLRVPLGRLRAHTDIFVTIA